MSLLKRFVTTVHTSVDRTLAGIENHEAVVDAALKDSREAVVRARVRLGRLEKDGRQQQDRVSELSSEIELWNERAKSVAGEDRAKALACIQRRKQRENELAMAREQLAEHEKIARRVRGNIEESANRVQALQNQRNQMRSREAAAHAGRIVNALDGKAGDDVEAAIERWEVTVGECEIMTDSMLPLDATDDELSQGFSSQEQTRLLEDELDELLASQGSKDE